MSTNDIKPYFHVDTWERCKELFTRMTVNQDDDRFFAQLIHKKLNDELGTAEASMRCNKKGIQYFILTTFVHTKLTHAIMYISILIEELTILDTTVFLIKRLMVYTLLLLWLLTK